MTREHPFRFGTIYEHMRSAEGLVTTAQRAEDLGYATFLVRDHFTPESFGAQFAPLTTLMAAANATKTLRIGSMVFDNDYRHPVVLAQEVATLDLLSGGRMEMGIGAGWLREEYEQAGLAFDAPGARVERLEESLQVLKGLFAEGSLTFSGRHYTITGLNGYPKPLQRPHPPMLIGAGSKRMLAIAAREADVISILPKALPGGTISEDATERLPATILQKIAWIREAAGERFNEIELSMIVSVIVTQDRQQRAEQIVGERGWHGISAEQVLEMPSLFVGTVEQIIEQMQQRREQYECSYYVVSSENMEQVASIVARLAGA